MGRLGIGIVTGWGVAGALAAGALATAVASGAGTPGEEEGEAALRIGPFSEALAGGALPAGWRPLEFARAVPSTEYRLVDDAGVVVVRADSRGSASGLTRSLDLDPREHPWLEWRWRVENLIQRSDVTRKQGDDYPARLYVAFAFDPEQAGVMERMQYEALRLLYGQYPPKAALNYIWSTSSPVGTVVPNPYSARATLVVVESGAAELGRWRAHRRNVVEDYQAFVGGPVPRIAGIAIMTDSDDTGESARAWFGDIVLRAGGRPPAEERLEESAPSD